MAAIVLILSILISSCSAKTSAPSARNGQGSRRAASADAVPVSTATVEDKAVPVEIAAVGTAEAISSVQIHAQVTGQLGEIHFAEGQDVQKGQPLFTLDPRPFQLALAQAQAVLAKDTAQDVNAEKEVARYKPLLDRGLISREQYDSYTATAAAARATIGADQAAVDTASLNLQFTHITAPISGRAGALMVHPGDLIRANDAMPMVTINQMSPINVSFAVPGKILDDVRHYQADGPLRVAALLGGKPGAPPVGRVTFIDNAVDPTTGTIRLKAIFDNPARALWPGAFVNVTMRLTTAPHAIVAPSQAIQASQNGQYAYVVKEDGTVDMRPVTVARIVGPQSVIATGLRAGETVVTDGQLRLTPGARVTLHQAPVATSGATR